MISPSNGKFYKPEQWKRKFHTFIYGVSDEAGLPGLIAQAEDDGCELVQVFPASMPDPRPPNLLVPGQAQRPAMVAVYRPLVRIPLDAYPALVEKHKAAQEAGKK